MHSMLAELVQAGLGDLDGHPEQRMGLGFDADDLGRPWAPGSKRRDRSRPTVMATSSGGSGATVSCEGDGARAGGVANGRTRAVHREHTVGQARDASTRLLVTFIREAFGAEPRNVDLASVRHKNDGSKRFWEHQTFAAAVEHAWSRALGRKYSAEGHMVRDGVVLEMDDLPSEDAIETWVRRTFGPYGISPRWDAVNLDSGPGLHVALSNADIRALLRDGF